MSRRYYSIRDAMKEVANWLPGGQDHKFRFIEALLHVKLDEAKAAGKIVSPRSHQFNRYASVNWVKKIIKMRHDGFVFDKHGKWVKKDS